MPTSLLCEHLSPSQCTLPCVCYALEERLLQRLCFTRNDGDWVVVLLLIRLGTACLGWVCLHAERATIQGHPVRDTWVSLWHWSLVSLPSLLGWRRTEYGLSSVAGLRLFASGHIALRQHWGSFAIQPPECWLSRGTFERSGNILGYNVRFGPHSYFPDAPTIELGHGESAFVSALVHCKASAVWPRAHRLWGCEAGATQLLCSSELSC